ncbi:MAG: WD40 repeat domain-containing protein [Pseudomonadales bacterium]
MSRRKSLLPALWLLIFSGCSNDAEQTLSLAAQGVYAGALSEDGELALIGSMNHGASLWQRSSNERLFSWNHKAGEFSTLISTAFSPNGTRAATCDPRTLVVWDTQSGKDMAFWGLPAAALDVALDNTGRKVLLGLEDHSALLFDAASGAHLHTFLHQGVVGTVTLDHMASVALTGSDDETARIWDLATGTERFKLQHRNPVRTVALSADGTLAFTASQNQRVRVWDATTGTAVRTLYERNPGVTSARFSSDGSLLLLGLVNRTVELFIVASGKRVQSWRLSSDKPLKTSGRSILDVAFAANSGRYFSISGSGDVSTLVAR